jgi:hypothetical protein
MFKTRNLAISMAAGNATIWKPSQTTPLSSIAVTKIISGVLERNGIPGAVASLVTGDKYTGEALVESRDIDMGTLHGLSFPLGLNGARLQCRLPEVKLLAELSVKQFNPDSARSFLNWAVTMVRCAEQTVRRDTNEW